MAKTKYNSIMLIDDDQQHNEMLTDYLKQRYTMEIHSFTSGEEALQKLDELKPTYIILDYYLDRVKKDAKDGITILKNIRERFPDTHVVMLSGQDKIEVAVDSMKFGAYDYVVKNPSGFVRVENVMKNIRENLRLKFMMRAYRFATIFLVSAIVLILLIAIILRALGISTDDIGW
ncbi:MAG TPA: response regulator [Chitinophagales bacterium]|nr:response regulator [Chitinophagales bacterium]